ncbi:hypothetical protein FKM82_020845 [Ascaphus truei]
MKHGLGTFMYPDGSKYEGDWVGDQRHGQGIYSYANGDSYNGDWFAHQRHGQGVYRYADTGSKYIGTWVNGKQEGAGELIHQNHRYQGSFTSNSLLGPGKYVFDIGCEQHGVYEQADQEKEAEEEEEPLTLPVTKWKAEKMTGLTLWSPTEVVRPPAAVIAEPGEGEEAVPTDAPAQPADAAPETTEEVTEPTRAAPLNVSFEYPEAETEPTTTLPESRPSEAEEAREPAYDTVN